jgi:hypothetical protein
MKYLKSYKIFEKDEDQENINDIEDIFIHVKDLGLEISDVYSGHSLSLGDKQIVTDHMEFSKIGPDGKFVDSFKSINIRLKPYKKDNTLGSFHIDNEVYDELESAINHVESQFNCEFSNLYLRTTNGVWFSKVSIMKEYIDNLPFAKKQSLKWVSYLDLTFRVLESTNESATSSILDSIVDDVKDILKDLEDDHEIDVDTIVGQYHKMYSGGNPAKSWKESEDSELKDSINIDLKDNKNNFFRFNDHILPTIKKLRSFLSEYDLNIDIELVTGKTNNEFYSLDEFIEEYGSEEFHELGIIIYN